ncbi:MAG: hypothetical protein M1818_002896 [Claussenomyces sp. TS43310]|nr:MAG: hypothetical protein M1818_002896 [Claussenomyces sp. TS43310]
MDAIIRGIEEELRAWARIFEQDDEEGVEEEEEDEEEVHDRISTPSEERLRASKEKVENWLAALPDELDPMERCE